jgi:hypothetical protein
MSLIVLFKTVLFHFCLQNTISGKVIQSHTEMVNFFSTKSIMQSLILDLFYFILLLS